MHEVSCGHRVGPRRSSRLKGDDPHRAPSRSLEGLSAAAHSADAGASPRRARAAAPERRGLPRCRDHGRELSSEPRAPDAPPADRLDHAARHFFRVLDPYLTNRPPERANDGQISRASLQPIWDWLSRDLMASMARGYAAELKQFLAAGKQREVDLAAHGFQNKAVKYLQGTLASESGAEQARARLGKHGGSAATSGDLVKILRVLKARDALAALDEDLP